MARQRSTALSMLGGSHGLDNLIRISEPLPNGRGRTKSRPSRSVGVVSHDARFPSDCCSLGRRRRGRFFDQLLKIIENKKPGSIVELGLVGHASPTAFALAGTETTRNIRFDPKGLIHPDTIHDKLARITALRDRFKTGDKDNPPSITLFACDAGSGDDLLEAISSAFQVTARGFQHEIWWCFMVIKRAAVRGRTWYDGVGMGVHPQCDSDRFSVDIRTWKPDKQKVAKSQRQRWGEGLRS